MTLKQISGENEAFNKFMTVAKIKFIAYIINVVCSPQANKSAVEFSQYEPSGYCRATCSLTA